MHTDCQSEPEKIAYNKLLQFLDRTHYYSVDRIFGLLPSDGQWFLCYIDCEALNWVVLGLFEAKAILLGRLGRHDSALEIYVYRLHDFVAAEE